MNSKSFGKRLNSHTYTFRVGCRAFSFRRNLISSAANGSLSEIYEWRRWRWREKSRRRNDLYKLYVLIIHNCNLSIWLTAESVGRQRRNRFISSRRVSISSVAIHAQSGTTRSGHRYARMPHKQNLFARKPNRNKSIHRINMCFGRRARRIVCCVLCTSIATIVIWYTQAHTLYTEVDICNNGTPFIIGQFAIRSIYQFQCDRIVSKFFVRVVVERTRKSRRCWNLFTLHIGKCE